MKESIIFWKLATMEQTVNNIKWFTKYTRQSCKVKELKYEWTL